MPNPDTLILTTGAVAFAGNFKEAGGFPPNGATIIAATAALTVLMAMTKGTPVKGPATAFAGLALLVAVFRYVPALYNPKGKNNG